MSGNNSAVYVDPSTGAISTGAVQFRNRIINGDMRIDQRLAGTANAALLTGQDVYTADRWAVWRNASGANYTVQRIANAGAPGNDFALQATVTTSATPGTNDIYFMHQKIEGYNVNDFGLGTANAAFFTISFHVRSSVTGTFGLIATNAAKNRSFATTYTVNAANIWEYKVITIKGDVTGTWAKDNTTGLDIIWSLGAGSGASTAASGAWVAGGFYNVTGAVQFVGSAVGATFALTNVSVEKGGVATPFEVRPFAMELGMCQRYYESSLGLQLRYAANRFATSTSAYGLVLAFKVMKSKLPSLVNAPLTWTIWFDVSGSTGTPDAIINTDNNSLHSMSLNVTRSAGLSSGPVFVAGAWAVEAEL
jgi:hypothetical protein